MKKSSANNVTAYKQKHTKDTPLNDLRIEKNLTVSEIAKRMGLSVGTISILFNHTKTPTKDTLMKLAEVFDMEYAALCKRIGVDTESLQTKRMAKNTFWNRIRTEAGLTINEVAEGIGKQGKRVMIGKYFTGEAMPSDDTIRAICNLFDIDFTKGKEEFINAHIVWLPRNGKPDVAAKKNVRAKVTKTSTATRKLAETAFDNLETIPLNGRLMTKKDEVTPAPETVKDTTFNTEDIERRVYGNVSYDEFNFVRDNIRNAKSGDSVLETIYGKVDCATYNTVYDLIKK